MKAVITVIGNDRPGIIAKVTTILFERGINIDDISQTTMQGLFTMVMIVSLQEMKCSFEALQTRVQLCAEELCMEIRVQREEVFTAMHQV